MRCFKKMSSILDKIIAAKRAEVENKRRLAPLSELTARIASVEPTRPFAAALRKHAPAIIAEIKRASPSKGDIMPGLDPAAVARAYAAAGAAALSVLTDAHFKGSLDDLSAVREAVSLPLLRKDFVVDPYQVYESRCAGADCILLIVAALPGAELLHSLLRLARDLRMAALVEVHNAAEMTMAEDAGAGLIGINNRDLHSFRTDLGVTVELLRGYRGEALIVSESGIETADDIVRLSRSGAGAFLVGESLLRDGAPAASLARLTGVRLPAKDIGLS